MNKWPLGDYLSSILESMGGRKAGKTQTWLADKAGLSQSYVNYLLTGKASGKKNPPTPTIATFNKLADALNVSAKDLADVYSGRSIMKSDVDYEALYNQTISGLLEWVPDDLLLEEIIKREPKSFKTVFEGLPERGKLQIIEQIKSMYYLHDEVKKIDAESKDK